MFRFEIASREIPIQEMRRRAGPELLIMRAKANPEARGLPNTVHAETMHTPLP